MQEEVVGVRFSPHGALVWFRAGDMPAMAGSFVVAERDGVELVGQAIVGRGQCLSFPGDPAELPSLVRDATEAELPRPVARAGQALLDSLP